ncbi:MAG: Crp/Fnr family transcriptional regulator [Bacteroidales bacterium]|nr:Crp/Fnr family transcriptional regulator [Bacteroidales bacterium]
MFHGLAQCEIFRGINPSELETLLSVINYQVKRFSRDDLIALAGDRINSLQIVAEGSVKGEMIDFTGKTIKIEDIEAPRPLAPAFLFGENNSYPVNIVANNNVTIVTIPKKEFVRMLILSEKLLHNYLDIISSRAQFLSARLKFLSFQSIKGKIAHYLLSKSSQNRSGNLELDKSQSELAELFGVTRPSLARAVRELDRDGIIRAKGRKVTILNPARLSAFLK